MNTEVLETETVDEVERVRRHVARIRRQIKELYEAIDRQNADVERRAA